MSMVAKIRQEALFQSSLLRIWVIFHCLSNINGCVIVQAVNW